MDCLVHIKELNNCTPITMENDDFLNIIFSCSIGRDLKTFANKEIPGNGIGKGSRIPTLIRGCTVPG